MTKKFAAGSWFTLLAAVAGVVGVIAMLRSSNIDTAYAYKTVNTLLLMGIGGIVLCLIAVWSPTKFGNHDFISTIEKLINNGITVVIGTQCPYEGSKMDVYETGKRSLEIGALQAHDMTSEAALTKLMWILGMTDNPSEIRDYYSINIAGEITAPLP